MRLRLIPEKTEIDFFRTMRFWLVISVLAVVVSLVLVPTRGLNFGVDFRGGTLIMAEVPDARPIGDFRSLLGGLDVGDVAVTEASGGSGGQVVMMRIGMEGGEGEGQAVVERVQDALDAEFPGIEYLQVDSVGAKVSGELVRTGFMAVLLALGAIMVYVWLRFEWQFAVGAVLALFHDSIITVGLFSALQLEFNLTIIAAILTIIGYSINDTVVVFDRVRENLRKFKTTRSGTC
jgi:preprotein translocase subunit SecF